MLSAEACTVRCTPQYNITHADNMTPCAASGRISLSAWDLEMEHFQSSIAEDPECLLGPWAKPAAQGGLPFPDHGSAAFLDPQEVGSGKQRLW